MDLQEFTSPLPKPWLNINANAINAVDVTTDTLTATTFVVDSIETESLTFNNVAAVPNPAVGQSTAFADLSGYLKTTDGLGNTVSYLANPAQASENMNNNGLTNVGSIAMTGDINLANNDITNVGNLTMNGNVNINGNQILNCSGLSMTGDIDMDQHSIVNCNVIQAAQLAGEAALLQDGLQDQAYPLAPAGQRDLWQYGGVATGSLVRYWASVDLYHSFDNAVGAASYSNDGGVTWNPCVFDVVSAGFIRIGYNGVIWAAVASGANNSYTSVDGINFTSGPALPTTGQEGFNIEWFASAGLFLTGVTDAGTRIMSSPDGLTWTLRTATASAINIKSNATVAVAVGESGAFYQWSADGITWTDTVSVVAGSRALAYSSEKKQWMAIVYATGVIFKSDNGETWTNAGSAPINVNDTLQYVGDNNYNHWYLSVVDSDFNYSLWSTSDADLDFVGTHLDGARNDSPAYSSGYDASRDRFWIGTNNSPFFAYGTARLTSIKSLGDAIRIRGFPASVGCYSMYTSTTCDNTVVETDISTNASSIGSLALQAAQPLGMVYAFDVCMTVSSAAGDTLDIRFKTNGGLLWTHNLVVPALSVNLPITICARITIRNGAIHVCSSATMSGAVTTIVDSAIVYDRTILNTWSVTAQWGAALSTLDCGMMHTHSRLING